MNMARQNIFLELGFPEHEAAVMLVRADLAQEIRQWLKRHRLSQVAAARILGISAPRLNEIVKNRVEKVSVDYLLGLCAKGEIPVSIKLGTAFDKTDPDQGRAEFEAVARRRYEGIVASEKTIPWAEMRGQLRARLAVKKARKPVKRIH